VTVEPRSGAGRRGLRLQNVNRDDSSVASSAALNVPTGGFWVSLRSTTQEPVQQDHKAAPTGVAHVSFIVLDAVRFQELNELIPK